MAEDATLRYRVARGARVRRCAGGAARPAQSRRSRDRGARPPGRVAERKPRSRNRSTIGWSTDGSVRYDTDRRLPARRRFRGAIPPREREHRVARDAEGLVGAKSLQHLLDHGQARDDVIEGDDAFQIEGVFRKTSIQTEVSTRVTADLSGARHGASAGDCLPTVPSPAGRESVLPWPGVRIPRALARPSGNMFSRHSAAWLRRGVLPEAQDSYASCVSSTDSRNGRQGLHAD